MFLKKISLSGSKRNKNPSTIWKTTLSQIKEYEAIALSKKMLWVL